MAGSLTSTPLYMSPEAIERSDAIDARNDLYAVGTVGYFLLTAQPLFDGKNVLDTCAQQLNSMPALGCCIESILEKTLVIGNLCLLGGAAVNNQSMSDDGRLFRRQGNWFAAVVHNVLHPVIPQQPSRWELGER